MKNIYDIIIVGGGPAGLSAAIYTARDNKKTLILDKGSSDLEKGSVIENYFGIEDISGKDLILRGRKQAQSFGAEIKEEEVVQIAKTKNFIVKTVNNEYLAPYVLLATGIKHEKPNVKNLEKFVGRGVSYCVPCDGFFFRGKKVSLIGSKNYAAHEALELLTYTKNITIFSNKQKIDMDKNLFRKLKENNIQIRDDRIKEVVGDKIVRGLMMEDGEMFECDGIFVAVGNSNATDFAKTLGIEMIDGKYIKTDDMQRTTIPGIYAAGDCTGGNFQLSVAVGEGSDAALNILREINKKEVIDYKHIRHHQ